MWTSPWAYLYLTKSLYQEMNVADIEDGLLYRAKIENYSILKYARDNETVAVTLTE